MPAGTRRSHHAIIALRVIVAVLLTVHGWTRLVSGGVAPFGERLLSQGLPLGVRTADTITGYEIVGPVFLAWGRWVRPLALGHACILAIGIVLLHGREGWFVVGLGRNGAEYSVLLIACLLALAYSYRPHPHPRTRHQGHRL